MKQRINNAQVTVQDLLRAAAEVHKLPPNRRDWEGRLITMARLFRGEPDKALAIEYRLVAMSRMLDSGVLPGWAQPMTPDGSVSVADPVWQATATAPLEFGAEKEEPFFNKESFLSQVLELAKPEGHA